MYKVGEQVLFVANPLESYHDYHLRVGKTGVVIEVDESGSVPYPYLVDIEGHKMLLSPEELEKAH